MLKATQLISDETVIPSHICPHSPGSQPPGGLVAWEKTFSHLFDPKAILLHPDYAGEFPESCQNAAFPTAG